MRLVFLGAPGSGKGTQAAFLVERLGLRHVSTGEVFRKAIAEQTPLGREAKRFLDEGLLVPDAIVLGMVDSVLDGLLESSGFILDGFPRTVPQAEQLELVLERKGKPLDAVIHFEVPVEQLVQRMLERKRADDTEETIRKRLRVYQEQTQPLIAFYESRGLLQTVSASGTVAQVSEMLNFALSEIAALSTQKQRTPPPDFGEPKSPSPAGG